MEGCVFLCAWERKGVNFTLTLKSAPSISVTAPTLQEAEEEMVGIICERFGDGEAVIDYETPLPKDIFPARYAKPELYRIDPNDSTHSRGDPAAYFKGGRCRGCGNRLYANRTETPAAYDWLPSNSDGALDWQQTGHLFSGEFLRLLPDQDRINLAFRMVDYQGKKRIQKEFHELIGNPILDLVASNRIPVTNAFRCRECGFTQLIHILHGKMVDCIAKSDLPSPCPDVFAVRTVCGSVRLCATGSFWRRVQGGKGTKNLMGIQVCVLGDNETVRSPSIPLSYQEGDKWITAPPATSNLNLAEELKKRHEIEKDW